MPRRIIERIRERIRLRQYDMTAHAMEEMAEDHLDLPDVEEAMLHGSVVRTIKDDTRGTRYVIEGLATDQRSPVTVVGRFTSSGRYLIVTVYAIADKKE